MNNDGEGMDRAVAVAVARKAASDPIAFLKSAASVVKPKAEMVEPPVVAPRGQGTTVISTNVEIVGTVNSPDDLHIYGKIEGNVRATSVTVCEGGSVLGDIMAETVAVSGKVEGRLYGRRVQLHATAVVCGDVVHNSLGIDPSALFEGASRRVADPLGDNSSQPMAANAA